MNAQDNKQEEITFEDMNSGGSESVSEAASSGAEETAAQKSPAFSDAEETAAKPASVPDADETASESSAAGSTGNGKNSKKRKKGRKKLVKWLIIAGAAAAVLGFFIWKTKKSAADVYLEDTVSKRDIVTYHTFTGTAAAVDSRSVMSAVSGVKVTEVPVEEGDYVKEGDVIAVLDSSGLDEQISEKKAAMAASANSSSIQIRSAQHSYNSLQSNVKDGLDSSLQGAQAGIDSAFSGLVSAQQAFNNEVNLNNRQLSATILGAIQNVDNAYNAVQRAALSTQQAKDAQAHAEQQAEDAGLPYDKFSSSQDDKFSSSQAIESSELSEDQAWDAYNQAVTSYEAAKINEENQLTQLFDSLITAQNSYLNAVDSYNAAVRSTKQQLESYSLQVQQAQAGADDTVSRLQLDNLEDQRKDYTITAPISGQITKLSVKTGDITAVSNTTSLATITNYDKMKVDIKVGEYDIVDLKSGDPVTIRIQALKKDYTGKIAHIDREATVENGVSYFNAEVNFAPDENVRGGMSAEVKLTINDLHDVLSISNDAVQNADDGSSYVLVRSEDGKTYTRKNVTLGATDGSYTQVTDGLSDGDKVYYLPAKAPGLQEGLYMGTDEGPADGTDDSGAPADGDAAQAE